MRKLMWFTIGFAVSCVYCVYFMTEDILLLLALGAAVAALAGWLVSVRLCKKAVISVALLGVAAGLSWFWVFDGYYLKPIAQLDGVTTEAVIEIMDYSYNTDYGTAVDGVSFWQDREVRLKLYLDEQDIFLNPGDELRGTFIFRITNAGGEKDPTYHRGRGITLIAYEEGDYQVKSAAMPLWRYPAAFVRSELTKSIVSAFPEDTVAFAMALLLGDDSLIDYETDTALKISGIRHIIAVSGLHVSILFSFIYLISGKNRIFTALLGIPLLAFFAMVAGLTPSVIRACLMHGLMMLAMLWDREYDSLSALSFAALTMMVVNPVVVTDIGFQLSFGCMLGILVFSSRIRNWLLADNRWGYREGKTLKAKLIRAIAGSISVSVGAMVFSTPLAALHFGTVSLIGVVTNLMTIWVVTVAFYGVMAAAIIGLFWLPGAVLTGWIVSWPIRLILITAEVLSEFPLAAVYTRSNEILIWLICSYLLLGLLLLMKKKRPVLAGSIVLFGLCGALLLAWLVPRQDACRVTVLNVGQGQSIILQSKGHTFLVDCGGDYGDDAADIAAQTLLSMGINRIEGLIVTHYDADHTGGVMQFLSSIQADHLFLPAYDPSTEISQQLLSYTGGAVHQVDDNYVIGAGEGKITIYTSLAAKGNNESSLCILFQAGDCDILITGDRTALGEQILLKQFSLPKLEVLIAGHHGAKDATSEELLDALRPQIAIISAGEHNRYGHPHAEVLQRLEENGVLVFRTDLDGTIIFRGLTHGKENGTIE